MVRLSDKTKLFIASHRNDDPKHLALSAHKYADIDMQEAITQISARQAAIHKIPSWANIDEIIYPRHISMEQCSSENTAQYKASIVNGTSFTDLTGGFGVDCAFIARGFEEAHYVERQKELCHIAKNNFEILHLPHIAVHNLEATDYLSSMSPCDWIFIDPARRDDKGGKTVEISDCEPNIEQLEEELVTKANNVMVKLSPMLDIAKAINTLKYVKEVYVVSAGNECKELLLLLSKNQEQTKIPYHCINLTSTSNQPIFCFSKEEEIQTECSYTDTVEQFLYEPNASILKAGAFKSIAHTYDVKKLHPNSHLYTSSHFIESFPGRVFEVESQCSFNKKELKQMIGDMRKANITIRNFPSTVAELRKRLKLKEGGEDYIFATTLANENKVLLKGKKRK